MSRGPVVMVHMRHLRQAKWCAAGTRAWLAHHGFDQLDFIRNGINAERLEATGDALALRAVALAREELLAAARAEALRGQ